MPATKPTAFAMGPETRRGMARCNYPGSWQIGIYNVVRCGDGLWAATAVGPGTLGDGSVGRTFASLAAAYLFLTGEPMPGASAAYGARA